MKEYDYSSYGQIKSLAKDFSYWKKLARKLGIKNRYIRFVSDIPKDASIVELGCGDGSFIKDLLDEGYKNVQGVEPSKTYEFVVGREFISFDYAAQFLERCPEASIDVIIALDVFEHIPHEDLKNIFATIKSRLTSKGVVVFRVPNLASPFALINYFGDMSHTTPFTESSIYQLAFNSGLNIEAVHPEPFAYPRTLSTMVGILIWPIFIIVYKCLLATFGIQVKILSPNLVCKLAKH